MVCEKEKVSYSEVNKDRDHVHDDANAWDRIEIDFVDIGDDIGDDAEAQDAAVTDGVDVFEKIEVDFIDSREKIETKLFNILIVDDNDGDIFLIKKAFENQDDFRAVVAVENDGDQALQRIREAGVEKPDAILLDINMPGRNGKEVLKEIKTDEALKDITVIMLSSSESESDIRECINLMADGFLTKPCAASDFGEVISIVKLYCH